MQLRGSARLVAYALICLFAVYIPLNVVYVLLTNSSHHLPKELASGVGSSSDISLSIKEIVPHQDGTVDLVLNFNIHDLMNAVDNPKVKFVIKIIIISLLQTKLYIHKKKCKYENKTPKI